jgi:hypothetical protein
MHDRVTVHFSVARGRLLSQLHHLLDDIKQAMTTTAALRGVASNGIARVIVASSDRYLPSIIKRALASGEIAASGKGHAEITAIEKALELGLSQSKSL